DPRDAEGRLVRRTFGGSPGAFGHPGAGGSIAFADPAHRIGFAYVMNQMEPGALPRERTHRLVRALYGL
ncbi:MAG: serine hydrolase, partial [Terrimicrobiaceae bacterium]|nr:serine hydrolase [Terrimicrobiaceae bacterium]